MNFESPPSESFDSAPQPLSVGGWLAWLVIGLVTVGVFTMIAAGGKGEEVATTEDLSSAELAQFELQGKLLVAQRQLAGMAATSTPAPDPPSTEAPAEAPTEGAAGEETNEEAVREEETEDESSAAGSSDGPVKSFVVPAGLPAELDMGPYSQRLCYSILVNELYGPVEARKHMQTTDRRVASAKLELSGEQKQLRNSIISLLDSYAEGDYRADVLASVLSPADQELLKGRLGWYGDLILTPQQSPDATRRGEVVAEATGTMFSLFGTFLVGVLVAIAGFIIAIVFIVMLAAGKLKSRYRHQTGRHNIYAETFAIWMVVFFGGQIPFGLALGAMGVVDELSQMMWTPLLFFGSLLVLVWPVIRGISFPDVCRDIGWTGVNPFVDGGIAGALYSAILPVLFPAVISVVVLMALFGPQSSAEDFSRMGGPSHPIQEYLAEGNLFVFGVVLVMACVAAPIVEETMFRGVFYRHLRDATAGWSRWVSVALACLINSLVFASIHPQGIFGIPLLMTLAIGFSLAREWRGSLFAPMLMHAINNFLVTTFAFFMM